MTAIHQGAAGPGHQSSPPSRAGAFLKFADLDNLQVIVIHTGEVVADGEPTAAIAAYRELMA